MTAPTSLPNRGRRLLPCLAFLGLLAPAAGAHAQSWQCSLNPSPTVSSTVPNDVVISNQFAMNCFAWQEFIALNWAAAAGQRGVADPNATPAMFGSPSASGLTVWETYKDKSEVFLPLGAEPKPWEAPPPPPACQNAAAVTIALQNPRVQVLSMLSAFGDFRLDETTQASGQWLADQNGNLIYYDIRIDKGEFDWIVKNKFYNADVQNKTAATGVNPTPGGDYQVKLPAGCNEGGCPAPQLGAIELKAAWRILTNPAEYGRYLTSQAVLISPSGVCSPATIGLVALHIIHKTALQPQFIWATFEQVDNVPPAATATPTTFNSPNCQCTNQIPDSCLTSKPPSPVYQNCEAGQRVCAPNNTTPLPVTPPYNITASCPAYAVQVTRYRPISNTTIDPVADTNTAAMQLIRSADPQSVFQYYQLVDVLWSNSPQDPYTNDKGHPGPPAPLYVMQQVPEPVSLPVANTTMETYVQGMTCLNCHIAATVPNGPYASDYSFLLGDATSPTVLNLAAAPERQRHFPAGLIKLNR